MAPMGVPWPSRGVPWPLYEEYGLEDPYYIYYYHLHFLIAVFSYSVFEAACVF